VSTSICSYLERKNSNGKPSNHIDLFNWAHSMFTYTSVASAVHPSGNTLRAQLIFPSKPNFCNLFEFPATKSTQTSISSHLSSENCKINSVKSDWWRAFQQHQRRFQIAIWFSVSILFNFHWENGSIINSFYTVAPNTIKPSQCTPTL